MIDTTPHLDDMQLSALIDGELTPADQQTLEQHLSACHSCTLRTLNATRLKAATARAALRFTPSPDALSRLTAQLHSQIQQAATQHELKPGPQLQQTTQPTPIRPRRTSLYALGALAATLLIAELLFTSHQFNTRNTLNAELLDQHLSTLSSAATPQVISTDRHTVKPWFQGRLPFSFNLPDPAALPPDTALKGADLAYLDNQPAALLLFTIREHQVSVFVTQRSLSPDVAAQTSRNGFNIHSATTPNLRLTALSDVNPTDLDALLNTLVKAQ
jgi:anti-sigma factor RsiW